VNKISSGWCRAGQAAIVGFFTLMGTGLGALVYQSPDWGSAVLLGSVLGAGFLCVRNALAFHDVYVAEGRTFVLKHLFYTRRLAAGDVRGVRAGLLPTSFCLATAQRDFYFSVIDLQDLATELTSVQNNTTLKALNHQVQQMQQASA
jgi:hypothetical protein